MSGPATVLIVSDPHYAGAAEQARRGYELACAPNWAVRQLIGLYRGYYWLRDPLGNGPFLDAFLQRSGPADFVIANGDYSADSAFITLGRTSPCPPSGSSSPARALRSPSVSGPSVPLGEVTS